MKIFLTIVFIALAGGLQSQAVYEPPSAPVYSLLGELTRMGVIDWNTAVKPVSRHRIGGFLKQAAKDTTLTERQAEQVGFYLRDYDWKNSDNPRFNAFDYSSRDFSITVNPLISGELFGRSSKPDTGHTPGLARMIGAEVYGTAGKSFGYWFSLRDMSQPYDRAIMPGNFLMPGEGGVYKFSGDENDRLAEWDDVRGGLTYSWKWGHVGLAKDRFAWGNNQHGSNIFSLRPPSYFFIDLRVKPVEWLEFAYVHGWLNSQELDSSRTYLTPNGMRKVFQNKNLAANFATLRLPWKIDFSLGNSIVYSDDGVKPVYFIPFMFFKAIDHNHTGAGSNEAGQNSQLFFDLSIRTLPNVQFYTSWFIDEMSVRNIFDEDSQTNIWSFKAGAVASNVIADVELYAEYTANRPWVYRHQIRTTTFASNDYTLGHFAGENARELAGGVRWKPMRALTTAVSASRVQKGPVHQYAIVDGNANVTGLKFLEQVKAGRTVIEGSASYEVVNDGILWMNAQWQDTDGVSKRYLPAYYQGDGWYFEAGLRYGF